MSNEQRADVPQPARSAAMGIGEVISRVVFGGFWTLVALAAVGAAALLFSDGVAGGGMVCLGVAFLAGLYSRYIFRGGRFRFLFW